MVILLSYLEVIKGGLPKALISKTLLSPPATGPSYSMQLSNSIFIIMLPSPLISLAHSDSNSCILWLIEPSCAGPLYCASLFSVVLVTFTIPPPSLANIADSLKIILGGFSSAPYPFIADKFIDAFTLPIECSGNLITLWKFTYKTLLGFLVNSEYKSVVLSLKL